MTRMFLAAALIACMANVAPAAAEGSSSPPAATPRAKKAAKIPYRVVKLMPDTDQAIIYDREHDQHLLVQIGDDLGDFEVIDVDDEELTLWRDGREVVLVVDPAAPVPPAMLVHRPPVAAAPVASEPAAPPAPTPAVADTIPAPAPVVADTMPAPAPAVADTTLVRPPGVVADTTLVRPPGVVADTVLIDPYPAIGAPPAPVSTAPATPLDPYAAALPGPAPTPPATLAPAASGPATAVLLDPNAPHAVLAPPDQRASLETAATIDPYAEPKQPTVVAAPAGAEPIKGVPAPTSDAARAVEIRAAVMPLPRAQLESALAAFDKLHQDYGFERTPRGVRLDRVASDSYAYGLGLRAGDVIAAVDGKPLRTLDDAAAAYVRLGTEPQLSLDIERGASHGTLRFKLQ